jgi:rRNA maturation endonuclease Nob1
MQKKTLGERFNFNTERYGMIFYPQCNGQGKVFKTVKEFEACMACGGFVLIKTPREKQIDGKSDGCRFND